MCFIGDALSKFDCEAISMDEIKRFLKCLNSRSQDDVTIQEKLRHEEISKVLTFFSQV